jgi:hypothetical protein
MANIAQAVFMLTPNKMFLRLSLTTLNPSSSSLMLLNKKNSADAAKRGSPKPFVHSLRRRNISDHLKKKI